MISRLGDHSPIDFIGAGHQFRIWFHLAMGEDQNRAASLQVFNGPVKRNHTARGIHGDEDKKVFGNAHRMQETDVRYHYLQVFAWDAGSYGQRIYSAHVVRCHDQWTGRRHEFQTMGSHPGIEFRQRLPGRFYPKPISGTMPGI